MTGNKYIIIHGSAKDDKDAIAKCAQALHEAGIVGEQFGQKCIDREKDYPTGLPTETPVAIPHCSDDSVKENAICVLLLDNPVQFRRMDDDEETIMAQMVFNLAVTDPEEHLEALKNLMAFLTNEELLQVFTTGDEGAMMKCLKENIG